MRTVRRALVTLVTAAAFVVPSAAFAQYGTPTISPTNSTTDRNPPAPTLTVQGGRTDRPGLGVTGADVAGIAALGLGSAGLGTALVARSRRRRRSA